MGNYDKKISQLDELLGAETAADDLIPIRDTSAVKTKRIKRSELAKALAPEVAADPAITSQYGRRLNRLYGDGTTNATSHYMNMVEDIASEGGGVLYIPDDAGFLIDRHVLPLGVSIQGASRRSSWLINRSTDGGAFIQAEGSHVFVANLGIDGKKANQASYGTSSLLFAKQAGSGDLAGGLTLSGAVSSGATSITVASVSTIPVRAGEVITLVESSKYEQVRIAASYVSGTTIPLEYGTVNSFTTAAKVSVACTDITVKDCWVKASYRDGISLWHVVGGDITGNFVQDHTDTGIDLPSAGCSGISITDNTVESGGRWGIALDTAETEFGVTDGVSIKGNTVRIKANGSDPLQSLGTAVDAIWVGTATNVSVVGNTLDLRSAGISGINLARDASSATVFGNTIIGPSTPRAATAGIRRTEQFNDLIAPINGNIISGFANGIDFDLSERAIAIGNRITNITDYAINILANSTPVQTLVATDNYINGCTVGVRAGGTAAAGSTISADRNIILNASYAPVAKDSVWAYGTGDENYTA